MNDWMALLVTVLLLALNAFFVACEFTLTGSRSSRLVPLAARNKHARRLLWAINHLSEMLAACQLGVTLASVALGALAEPAVAHLLEGPFTAWGWSPAVAHTVALLIALLLVVGLHVVLGEMVPKNLAVTHPERAGMWFITPLLVFDRIFRPAIAALNWLSLHAVRLLGKHSKDDVGSAFTAGEVASIIEASEKAGVLKDSTGLISGTLEFTDRKAGVAAVPAADLVGFRIPFTPAQVEEMVGERGFSRYIVFDESGLPAGYIHIKDTLSVDDAERFIPVPEDRIRQLEVVDADAEAEDALRVMQRSGAHVVAVARDGQRVGAVFLEDLIEELVGEIRDLQQR
ncbi:CNNM domain-containing protein [Neoactinobaculum massilliense]|uniref:CNNM domain-containing protein n=1 Tax=Neoactinobaculum massilliense TaxID=2364794 RepID=UPI000F5212B2|nr:CNNM domain-containing protein [Neoactinobaculum massilliense]